MRRCILFLVFLLVLVLPYSLVGQTRTDIIIQTKANVLEPGLILVMPNNIVIPVKLDPSLELITNGGGTFLRVKTINAVVNFEEDFFKTSNPQNAFVTTKIVNGGKKALFVYRNGLLQREVEDYAAQENGGIWTITFNQSVPIGTFVTLRYPTS